MKRKIHTTINLLFLVLVVTGCTSTSKVVVPEQKIGQSQEGHSKSLILYNAWYQKARKKIEENGSAHWPTDGNQKLYGSVTIMFSVFQDGSLYAPAGEPKIERSSGNKLIDQAAINLVKISAPFEPIGKELRTLGKTDVFEVITSFNFEKDAENKIMLLK